MKGCFNKALALLMSSVIVFSCASVSLGAESCEHKNLTVTTLKEPTCQSEGTSQEVCNDCGYTKTSPINKSNHVHELTRTPANCVNGGYVTYDCKYCDNTITVEESSPLGHDWGNWTEDEKATCTKSGKKHRLCKRCNEKQEETIDKTGHKYDSYETVKNATCTEKGVIKFTCTRCNEEITEDVAPLGHETVLYPAVKATCTTPGKTEGKYCTKCKTMYVVQTDVPAKGHDEEITPEIPATCNGKGMSEGRICKVCGEVTKKRSELPAKGHNPVIIPGIEPTCISKGLTEGKKCANCGTVYVEQQEIPTSGHVIVIDKALPATCTKTGLTEGSHCSACGEVLMKQVIVPATGHSPVYYDIVPPTCDEVGKTAGSKCSVCTEILEGLELVPPLGHQEEIYQQKDATCTEPGMSEGRKCLVCGIVTKEQKIIPAKGHDEVSVSAVSATCQRTGLTEGRKCLVCKAVTVEQKTVEKTEHRYVATGAIAPTCTKPGTTAGKKCEICGLVASVPTTTPALGHSVKEELVKKATFAAEGEKDTYCERCNIRLSTEKFGYVKTIKLSTTSYIYDGKVKKPAVTVLDSNGKALVNGVDYTLTYGKGRTEPGLYRIKITLAGNYSGSKKVSFTIAPPKTTVKAGQTTSTIKIAWTKVHGADGYRVYRYDTSTSKWAVVIKSTTATSHTFKSLDSGKQYTYAVKPFKRADGKVIWSKYTSIVTVTKPLAPTISSAESTSAGSATINWKKVTGATGYVVYYSTNKNSGYKKWVATSAQTYTRNKLTSGKTYYIKIKAYTRTESGNIYSGASNARAVYIR